MFPALSRRMGSGRDSNGHLWWLNPIWPFAFMLLSTGFSAYIIPPNDYQDNWRTPKYFEADNLEFICLSVIGFVVCAYSLHFMFGPVRPAFSENIDKSLRIPWPAFWLMFYLSFGVTTIAYVIWLGVSLHEGLSFSDVIAALHNDPDAVYDIRNKSDTIPGVTTFTQIEMAMVLLGTLLGFKFGWKKSFWKLVPPMAIVFLFALIRAHFRDERVALLEIVIPMSILTIGLLKTSEWPLVSRVVLALGPMIAPFALYIFFSAAEYSRSWVNYYQGRSESSFLWFSFTRLVGYYVTALNNGAAFVQTIGQYEIPFHSLEWFWRFPVIKDVFRYQALSNAEPWDDYTDLLKQKLNPELNNPSGVFVIQLDYGYLGGIIFWCAAGVVAMLLYRAFLRGSLVGLLLYPFFYIGLLEVPRVLYWTGGRALPSWLMLFSLLFVALFAAAGDWQKRTKSSLAMTGPSFVQVRPSVGNRRGRFRLRPQRLL